MSFSILRSITSQLWAIDPSYVESITPFLVSLLNNEQVVLAAKPEPFLSMAGSNQAPQAASSAAQAEPGSIAIVRISGPMMKNDQPCGPAGTATIGQTLQQLAANPNVDGIILKIDSPGGTVDGTEDLARIVGSIKKPTMAFVDGMAASAAMWVASAAQEVMLNGQTAMVGSIGTISSFADMKPALEKAGVKFHKIKASRSVDKNTDFDNALNGLYDGYIKNTLDPINAVFTSAIEKNRAGKIDLGKEDVLTGKTYIGKAAIKAGLADSIGSLDMAIASLKNRITAKKQTRMTLAEQYPNLSAAAQMPTGAEALLNGSVEVTAEEMERLEQALANGQQAATTLVSLTTELEQANEALAIAQAADTGAQNLALQAENTSLKAEIAKLGKKMDAPLETNTDQDPPLTPAPPRKKFQHELTAEKYGL